MGKPIIIKGGTKGWVPGSHIANHNDSVPFCRESGEDMSKFLGLSYRRDVKKRER